MRIEPEMKLDFNSVLIRPKRSTLTSRKDVDINRTFNFKYTGKQWTGVPIVAANMDSTGTFAMFEALSKHGMMTALHKHYNYEQLCDHFSKEHALKNSFYSMGIGSADYEKFKAVKSIVGESLSKVCVDVANGYTQVFVDFIKKLRDEYPELVVMAGNVVTGDMTEELILSGADVVKVGIGGGCFMAGSMVETTDGMKPIEKIEIGDTVLTHTRAWRKVTNTFVHTHHKKIRQINGINSTPNHEYYVLHKKYQDVVTDENIHEFAEWVAAEDLTKDYLLLKTS